MNGRPVRVQVTAATTRDAIDLLAVRLKARLDRLARHWEAVRGGLPACVRAIGDTVALPCRVAARHDAAEQRKILRRKSYAPTACCTGSESPATDSRRCGRTRNSWPTGQGGQLETRDCG